MIVKTNDDSRLLLRLNQQYLSEEVFCSALLYLLIKEPDYVLFELRWGVCEGTRFICVLGQLVGKASQSIWKQQYLIIKKILIRKFLRNRVAIFKKRFAIRELRSFFSHPVFVMPGLTATLSAVSFLSVLTENIGFVKDVCRLLSIILSE